MVENQEDVSQHTPLIEETVLKGTASEKGKVIRLFEKVAKGSIQLK